MNQSHPSPRALPELRSELDRLDRSIIELLAERLDVCREVARAKERTNARIIQPARVREIWNSRRAWGAELGVDPAFVEQMFRTLLAETHRIESAEADGRHPIPAPAEIAYDSALQLSTTRIDHVVVGVPDVDAAVNLLVGRAGFALISSGDAVATVQAGSATIVLVEGDARTQIGLEVLDTDHTRVDLAERGCDTGPTRSYGNGVEAFLIGSDPALPVLLAVVSRTGERAEVDGSLVQTLENASPDLRLA